jgi:hypothetical protein
MIDNFITLNSPKAIEVFFLTIQIVLFPRDKFRALCSKPDHKLHHPHMQKNKNKKGSVILMRITKV